MKHMILAAALVLGFQHFAHAQEVTADSFDKNVLQFLDNADPEELQQALDNGELQVIENTTPEAGPLTTNLHIFVSIATETLVVKNAAGDVVMGPIAISSADTTGRVYGRPYHTKTGTFGKSCSSSAIRPVKNAVSKTYGNSPMPDAFFYFGGYAVHGTLEQSQLGHPASHGCVRISLANAAKLWNLVMANGGADHLCIDIH